MTETLDAKLANIALREELESVRRMWKETIDENVSLNLQLQKEQYRLHLARQAFRLIVALGDNLMVRPFCQPAITMAENALKVIGEDA